MKIFNRTAYSVRMTALALSFCIAIEARPSFARTVVPPLSQGAHDVALGDIRLHYLVRGAGPLLVVVPPGWGSSSIYLQNGLKPLERRFTLIYVDMRGSGSSSRPADRMRMSQSVMADDLEALRRYLGREALDLLGHSDGGTIALEYAERHGRHLRRLILVAPAILGDRDERETERTLKLWSEDPQFKRAVNEVATADWSRDFDDTTFERSLRKILPLYLADPARDSVRLARSFEATHFSSWAQRAQEEAARLEKRDQTKDLGSIGARTLIINGTVDWVCPYPAAQRLQKSVREASLSLYVNKGHFPWIEAAPRFFAEVTEFLLRRD